MELMKIQEFSLVEDLLELSEYLSNYHPDQIVIYKKENLNYILKLFKKLNIK